MTETDALAPIVARLNHAAHPDDPHHARVREAFARAVLKRVPSPELEEADPAKAAAAIADAFEFVDARPPGQISVRLIDTDVALDGRQPAGTLVEVSCEDRQFIVTSVREELVRLGQGIVRMLHPVYGAERGPDGRLRAVFPARTADHRESFLQVELAVRIPQDERPPLVEAVRRVLADVFAATEDYLAMRRAVAGASLQTRAYAGARFPEDEADEVADLLEWLLNGNFVLLGCCRFSRQGEAVETLGILARPHAELRSPPPAGDAELLRITRTRQVSTVHRQVPMHVIDVAEVSAAGALAEVFRVVGVFSVKANAEPAALTPVLRYKLRRLLELEDVVEGSQDEATLVSLFQVLPKDELFQADVPTLRTILAGLLAAEHQHAVRVHLRADPAAHSISALLSIPQEIYTPTLRQRIERFLLAQLDGSRVDVQVSLGDRADAVLRLVVAVDGPLPEGPLDDVERELRLLCRTWDQELAAALDARAGHSHLAERWAHRFPAVYREAVPPEQAVDDVLELDRLEDVRIVLRPDPTGRSHARLKVFVRGTALELSAFLPILESLGLWAVEELPYALAGPEPLNVHDFGVDDLVAGHLAVDKDGPRLAEAALALWRGKAESDGLNRLVLRAGMTWDDVAVLRAYRRYRRQVASAFTTGYMDDVLVEHGAIACDLLKLFAARFDPAQQPSPAAIAELRRRITAALDAVPRLDHDRILRSLLALVDATLRTNRYLEPAPGPTHVALKFDSAAVPDVPRPVPYREIFVHGPSVEGIHLRWGPVARGGIRWSDRIDDYRSEVLGLMRAQVLKNAVIVPTGAKGGFVVKRPRYGSAALTPTPDVKTAYETFVGSLLQVTDNVVGERVEPVPRRRDGDDPYLVVAADRGTAGFSDLANRISEERNFWLGDAFASGGSRGYNHKQLGITARGAWVAVTHHFAELGIDSDAEAVTVVGVGDMSGDVFGNAMLRSDRLRLVAAFDHRDVFLDPSPDPEASYQERARLFALPQSSWQDYDRARISPGGGVWSRLDKRIPLSEEARTALAADAAELTPSELIRAILQAPVTLLFAGGIGTFVRASTEPDQDLDDRANTDVRVEGSRIRARVVGEGANLAFTQRARIEYARRGGRINTDAIDNSGGVDISDREVNLKILLRQAMEAGELTLPERDRLLAEVCDEVVAAVLRDCAQQSLALSRAQAASPLLIDASETLMGELEATAVLDRAVEALPAAEEMRARAAAGAGLTRPELAVLLAGAKRSLTGQLLASDVPDQPALRELLVSYFPAPLARRFDHLLDRHRLRRELIASMMANDVVNRMGPTFVSRLHAETTAPPATVAAAYWIARGVAGASTGWNELDAHGTTEMAAAFSLLLEGLTRDYLRTATADIAAAIAEDRPGYAELAAAMPRIGTPERQRRRARRAEGLVDRGVDPALAIGWACMGELDIAPDVAELARETGRPVTGVAEAFLRLGERLGIDRLLDRLRRASVTDRWSRAAWQGLVDDLEDLRRLGTRQALAQADAIQPEAEAVDRFLAARATRLAEVNALIAEIEGEPVARLDAVAVAGRMLRRAIA